MKLVSFGMLTSALSLALTPAVVSARTQGLTDFSPSQIKAEKQADLRLQAGNLQGDITNGVFKTDIQGTQLGFDGVVSVMPELNLGLIYDQQDLEGDLDPTSIPGTTASLESNVDTANRELGAFVNYKVPAGAGHLVLSFELRQQDSEQDSKTTQTSFLGLREQTVSKIDYTLIRNQVGVAYEVDQLFAGLDYGFADKDGNLDDGYEYLPELLRAYAKLSVTDELAIGAAITQNRFRDLESLDDDFYRDYTVFEVAGSYQAGAMLAELRLTQSGADEQKLSDYTNRQAEAFLGYSVNEALQAGLGVGYVTTDYKDQDGEKFESDGLTLGLEGTYRI